MLTEEDDVEIHALARRGWSVSAIARHTGRDRKTVRKYLAEPRPAREPAPSCLEAFREYVIARGSSMTRTSTRRCSTARCSTSGSSGPT